MGRLHGLVAAKPAAGTPIVPLWPNDEAARQGIRQGPPWGGQQHGCTGNSAAPAIWEIWRGFFIPSGVSFLRVLRELRSRGWDCSVSRETTVGLPGKGPVPIAVWPTTLRSIHMGKKKRERPSNQREQFVGQPVLPSPRQIIVRKRLRLIRSERAGPVLNRKSFLSET